MLGRANLNTSYFTNRQDRYVQLTGQRELADYCFSFLEQAATFSFALLPSTLDGDRYILHWPHRDLHPYHFEKMAETTLKTFQETQRNCALVKSAPLISSESQDSDADVLVMPIIQAGQFNIREEEQCLDMLFKHLAESSTPLSQYERPLVDLTSGYFGLYKPYQDLIIDAPVASRILAASPKVSQISSLLTRTNFNQANGFYGSRGVSGRIPEGYTVLERRFMRAVRAAGREWPSDTLPEDLHDPGVQLSEWERDDWTYHAKGEYASFVSASVSS